MLKITLTNIFKKKIQNLFIAEKIYDYFSISLENSYDLWPGSLWKIFFNIIVFWSKFEKDTYIKQQFKPFSSVSCLYISSLSYTNPFFDISSLQIGQYCLMANVLDYLEARQFVLIQFDPLLHCSRIFIGYYTKIYQNQYV